MHTCVYFISYFFLTHTFQVFNNIYWKAVVYYYIQHSKVYSDFNMKADEEMVT